MTKKMTREEFVHEAEVLVASTPYDEPDHDRCWHRVADLAERAGVEWLPEQVEPKVGDTLTEATRRRDLLAVADSDGRVWQYVDEILAWSSPHYTECEGSSRDLLSRFGPCSIVFVPGEPVTEQKHGTRVSRDGLLRGTFRWDCACGAYDHEYIAEATAQRDAAKHEAQS
jgi:hypothetical protein